MMRIFEGASESLTSLTLEHHGELTVQDLLCLLKLVGKNLKILEIEGFLDSALEKEEHLALEGVSNHIAQSALTQQKEIETTIDTILEYCPRLKTLDFLEGLASEETPKRLARDGANVPLESWRFTCNERVSSVTTLPSTSRPAVHHCSRFAPLSTSSVRKSGSRLSNHHTSLRARGVESKLRVSCRSAGE